MSGRGRGGGGGGRGWYYKQKYGGGGRGRGGGGPRVEEYVKQEYSEPSSAAAEEDEYHVDEHLATRMARGSVAELTQALRRIDGTGYKAYHDIEGSWQFQAFTLFVDRAQSDPFASPSHCRVQVPASIAQLPTEFLRSTICRIALCDYLTRTFGRAVAAAGGDIRRETGGWGGEKGGEMSIDQPGQHVLQRTSVLIDTQGAVEARFTVALPARGRTVLGDWAHRILVGNLPGYVKQGLQYASQDASALARHVRCVEAQEVLRSALPGLGLIAFIGDGSILARASGASDAPMPAEEAVRFVAPPSVAVSVELPHVGTVRGWGVRPGVTLIVGGGFHGKTTVLKALEAGVYNKVPEDGRELVVTDLRAVKIRAEDGRRVEGVDISPFISNLPFGRDTRDFRSGDSSGSTSQAANIQEALEVGARCLLIDEDTSATNFMTRSTSMQALVAVEKEPITPFIARVRALAAADVSTILVVGGTGDYFEVADAVIGMECYQATDLTQQAAAVARCFAGGFSAAAGASGVYPGVRQRIPISIYAGTEGVKVKTRRLDVVQFGGAEELDLGAVEQLVEQSQTQAIAYALLLLRTRLATQPQLRGRTLAQLLDALEAEFDSQGLDVLAPRLRSGAFARPRRFEVAAAFNRLRTVAVRQAL